MKRIGSYIAIAMVAVLTLTVPAYALVKSDDTILVREDEVINDDLFAAGNEVTIEGTVNGDVYAGSSRLTIRGTVNGDVIGGAQNIEITGTIRDDLRVGGNNISLIGAKIGDSVSVAGNELSIDGDSTIGGGLIFGGRSLTLDGSVGRGITTGAESTRIDGEVGKTVRIAATNVTIDQDAVINGDLEYSSDNEAVIDGKISGEIIRSEGGGLDLNTEGLFKWFVVGYTAWAFIGAAIIGGFMLLLAPQLFRRSHEKFVKKPWKTAGVGAIITLATIPAVILLAVTVFGIPLAIVTLVTWLLGIYFAKFFVGYTIGAALISWIGKKPKTKAPHMYVALLLGLLIYYLLRLIPGFGFFVSLATTIVGFGMMLSLYSKPTKKTSR